MSGETLTIWLLWAGALGCGIMAGVYFAFSAFVMAALGAIPVAAGLSAMRSVNQVILRSFFMPIFVGTSIVALLLCGLGLSAAASWPAVVGAVVYLAGMTGVTMAFNVPLNTRLDRAGEGPVPAEAIWRHYLIVWTRWNHLRVAASAMASALFTLALIRSV